MEGLLSVSLIEFIVLNIIFLAIYLISFKLFKPKKNEAKGMLIIYVFTIAFLGALYYLKTVFDVNHLFIILTAIYSISSILTLKKLKIDNVKIEVLFILILILGTYLGYVSYTPYFARQHDSRNFYAPEYGGHFGYIGYIFNNNSLPDMNPKDYWCFFNPPLFYIISTIVLKIFNFFSFEIGEGFEFLQILSAIYTIVFIYYIYKILYELEIKKILPIVLIFIGLSPAIVFLSGSLNNDILSIMLSTIALYYSIRWYKEEKISYLITIAITIGLAMMTKVSSALIAVIIAIIFLKKVVEEVKNSDNRKERLKKYVINFSIFAIIALPIGLWFPIKNYVEYDIPFTYVQSVDLDNDSNISDYSTLERLFKIEGRVIYNSNIIQMDKENKEYNLYITTLKSFLLDEMIETEGNNILRITVHILLYFTIYISILFFINFIYSIYYLVKNKENDRWLYIFIALFILEVVSYIKFCFDFPFTFTMNFRYIVPTIICFGYIIGKNSEKNDKLYNINLISLEVYSLFCLIMFTNLL